MASSTGYTDDWASSVCDVFAQPGGCSMCMYAFGLPCCAASDIARYTGRNSYSALFGICFCIGPCCLWKSDREAVAVQHSIKSSRYDCCFCCLTPCMLTQTLNHIKAVKFAKDLSIAALVSKESTYLPQRPAPSCRAIKVFDNT